MTFAAKQRFGRYVALDSRLHGLDPFVKLLLFLTVMISIFLSGTWPQLAFVGGYILVLCVVSHVRLGFYFDSLKYFLWMFALSFAINVIFPRGDTASALSFRALNVAGVFSVRLALMILAATLLTVVMCPSEIGDSVLIVSRLGGRVGRGAVEFASLLSMSLRFVPVMFEEAERIKAAQMLRGQSASGLMGRIGLVVGLIVPLINSSLRRASNLGFALEARCYGYRLPQLAGLRLGSNEIIIGGSGLLILIGLVALRYM
jgi:energy-coupling factor transport system permease protein